MVKNIGVVVCQSDRTAIGDEVYLVPAAGKAQTQFGGYYSRSAVGWVTNNAYFHIQNWLGCAIYVPVFGKEQRAEGKVAFQMQSAYLALPT